ncbi:MAG: CRTAC1 family protein [Elusimicrobiota bacterium]
MNLKAVPFLACLLFAASEAGAATAAAPYFIDISSEAGLAGASAQNVNWADLNGDGYDDCVISGNKNGPAAEVFLSIKKDGRRAFLNFTEESGLNRHPLVSTAARVGSFQVFGDVDNDGDLDIFSGMYCEFEKPKTAPGSETPLRDEAGNIIYDKPDHGLRSEILLNDGSGRFTALKDSGVNLTPETATSAAFFDYDNDGNLDLFVGNWYKEYGISYVSCPSRLYRGLGGGSFEEVTSTAGLMTQPTEGKPDSGRPVYGVSHCDWNNDGFQDILAAVYGRQANRLWKNNGDGTFTDAGAATGFDGDEIRHGRYPAGSKREPEQEWRSHGNTFSAACADYDNDGDMDVYLGEITHGWAGEASDRSSLLENLGPKKNFAFRRDADVLHRVHQDTKSWNQGDMRVTWFDFDNDGLQDLLVSSGDYPDGQYLRLFRQIKPLQFEDVTDKAGFNWESSAGISLADYDGDGDLDILAGKSWMRMPAAKRSGEFPAGALFRNDAGNKNNWLAVTLEGRGAGGANLSAIGARVTARTGKKKQIREIAGGYGHAGQANSLTVNFGLGAAKKIDSLEVRWGGRAGSVSVFKNVPVNVFARIRQYPEQISFSTGPAGGPAASR